MQGKVRVEVQVEVEVQAQAQAQAQGTAYHSSWNDSRETGPLGLISLLTVSGNLNVCYCSALFVLFIANQAGAS